MSCKLIFTVVCVACMLICVIVIVRTFTLVPRQDVVIACKTTDKDYIKMTDDILKRFQQSLQFKTVSTKPGEVNRDQLLGLDNYIQKSTNLSFFKFFTLATDVKIIDIVLVTGQNAPTYYQNAPTIYQTPPLFIRTPHFFSKINRYKKNILCDSNVYKCLPMIRFCFNILFYYIFIDLFIKVINLINDECI